MLSSSGPSLGDESLGCTCSALSRSLDTRRVSFGSVEVFGSPEVSRSLDDNEAFRRVCKRKGVPLYSALPPPPAVPATGTSPNKVFPIFGFFFPSPQPVQAPPQETPPPDSANTAAASPAVATKSAAAEDDSSDSSAEGQSLSLSRESSSDTPSLSGYSSSSPNVLKSILKTTGSYKTSPGFLPDLNGNGCMNGACANCKAKQGSPMGTTFPIAVNGGSEGLFTAQLPPRPTPRRSLLRQAVHNMQQAGPSANVVVEPNGVSGSEGTGREEGGEQVHGSSQAAAVQGRDIQNGMNGNYWNGRHPGPWQQPPVQVMQYSVPAPVLRPYAESSRDDAMYKQPLLDHQQQEGGEEEWEEEYDMELCCWCPPCLQSMILGSGSTPSSKLIRI